MHRLTSWALVTVFLTVTHHLLDPVLSVIVPLYFVLKVAFVFWMVAPGSRGASLLFVRYIEPRMEYVEREMTQWWRELVGVRRTASWEEEDR